MYYESLIIVNGKVGSSLKKILDLRENREKTGIIDKKDKDFKKKLDELKCKTLHICFPYSKNFIKDVLKYLNKLKPSLCIIHSTVLVKTTSKINNLSFTTKIAPLTRTVHSPISEQYSDLEKSLVTLEKYVGTDNKDAFIAAKKEMENIKVVWFDKSESTELCKLLDTSYYGICVAWHREMERLCKYFGVKFENTVSQYNKSHNTGYSKLKPNVVRPILTSPGNKKITESYVVQNVKLLNSQRKSKFLELIK